MTGVQTCALPIYRLAVMADGLVEQIGSPETVEGGLARFTAETNADEIIVAAAVHDHAARLRSYELLGQLRAGPGA